MIGAKSIVINFKVRNLNSKEKCLVKVQANKNYSICDIIIPEGCSISREDFLNNFQGNQINDRDVVENLKDYLFNSLKK